jgi:hypothetical protein
VHYDACPLGHEKIDTTARYTRVVTGIIAKIESPLTRLSPPRRKPPRRDAEEPTAPGRRRSWLDQLLRSRTSPGPQSCLARGQPRPCEPRPIEGDERDRALPHGGARRARRALRERSVRPYADRLQFLPQPTLPEAPGCGPTPMADRPRSGAVARPLLSHRTSSTRCQASCATSPGRTSVWSTTS